MLKGIDVSNWNSSRSFKGNDFVIIKASEGKSYKDKMLDVHYNNAVKDGITLYGFYHYARPENENSPESEADFFLSQVGHHKGKAIFVLDWEQNALSYSTDWALAWMKRIEEKTNVKPLIYIQASQEWSGNYNKIRDCDYDLWVAHWGTKKPDVRNWGTWALWQYTDTPVDTNFFNGDANTWMKYCGSNSTSQKENREITVGDSVRVLSRHDYNDTVNDRWVLDYSFTVLEKPKENRVVIGINGVLVGAWKMEDLEWLG